MDTRWETKMFWLTVCCSSVPNDIFYRCRRRCQFCRWKTNGRQWLFIFVVRQCAPIVLWASSAKFIWYNYYNRKNLSPSSLLSRHFSSVFSMVLLSSSSRLRKIIFIWLCTFVAFVWRKLNLRIVIELMMENGGDILVWPFKARLGKDKPFD